MAETHETITDIIRKIRAEADSIEKSARGSLKVGEDLNGMPFTESDLESALDFAETKRKKADRLEAAHRREAAFHAMTCEANERLREHLQIALDADKRERGDCAKLREALIKARSAICHFARYQCQSLGWENSNIQANCGDVLCSWRGLCEAKTAINAALAAPPRNCDRPECATTKAAQDVWRREDGGKTAYYEWLLATATEQKVGTDEQK